MVSMFTSSSFASSLMFGGDGSGAVGSSGNGDQKINSLLEFQYQSQQDDGHHGGGGDGIIKHQPSQFPSSSPPPSSFPLASTSTSTSTSSSTSSSSTNNKYTSNNTSNSKSKVLPFHGPEYSRNLRSIPSSLLHDNDDNPTTTTTTSPSTSSTNINILTETLNSLSVQEREDIYDDVHGVRKLPTPKSYNVVQEKIQELQIEIYNVPNHEIYILAIQQSRACNTRNAKQHDGKQEDGKNDNNENDDCYVTSTKFLLKFLRSMNYHVKYTAIRIISYLEMKYELFGIVGLTTEYIQQFQLNEIYDLECLQSGYCQRLPVKDRTGRTILIGIPWGTNRPEVRRSKLRIMWYVLESTLRQQEQEEEDEMKKEQQTVSSTTTTFSSTKKNSTSNIGRHCKGCVGIFYTLASSSSSSSSNSTSTSTSTNPSIDRISFWQGLRITQLFPIRWAALHMCSSEQRLSTTFATMAATVYETQTRTRLRVHYGSNLEVHYALMTFGIPTNFLPVTSYGEITLVHHLDLLKQERIKEEKEQNMNTNLHQTCHHHYNDNMVEEVSLSPSNSAVLLRANNGTSTTTITPQDSNNTALRQQFEAGQGQVTPEPPSPTTSPSPPPPALSPPHPPIIMSSSSSRPGDIITTPGEFDILLGRGRCFRENPGNVRFHYVIEMHMERYEQSGKIVKQVLAEEIVERLKETGSRFLKKRKTTTTSTKKSGKSSGGGGSNSCWEVVTDTVAREKVSHSFRNRRTLRGVTATKTNTAARPFPSPPTHLSSSSSSSSTDPTNTSGKIMKHLLLLDHDSYNNDLNSDGGSGGGSYDVNMRNAINGNVFGQALWGNHGSGCGGGGAQSCGSWLFNTS